MKEVDKTKLEEQERRLQEAKDFRNKFNNYVSQRKGAQSGVINNRDRLDFTDEQEQQ